MENTVLEHKVNFAADRGAEGNYQDISNANFISSIQLKCWKCLGAGKSGTLRVVIAGLGRGNGFTTYFHLHSALVWGSAVLQTGSYRAI